MFPNFGLCLEPHKCHEWRSSSWDVIGKSVCSTEQRLINTTVITLEEKATCCRSFVPKKIRLKNIGDCLQAFISKMKIAFIWKPSSYARIIFPCFYFLHLCFFHFFHFLFIIALFFSLLLFVWWSSLGTADIYSYFFLRGSSGFPWCFQLF